MRLQCIKNTSYFIYCESNSYSRIIRNSKLISIILYLLLLSLKWRKRSATATTNAWNVWGHSMISLNVFGQRNYTICTQQMHEYSIIIFTVRAVYWKVWKYEIQRFFDYRLPLLLSAESVCTAKFTSRFKSAVDVGVVVDCYLCFFLFLHHSEFGSLLTTRLLRHSFCVCIEALRDAKKSH